MSKRRNAINLSLMLLLLSGCATEKLLTQEDFTIRDETALVTPAVTPPAATPRPKAPQDALAGKQITLSAKDADFRDILAAIAEHAGLDLVINARLMHRMDEESPAAPGEEPQSQPAKSRQGIAVPPVTVAFEATPLAEALEGLAESLNLFVTVRGGSLYVTGIQSRTYHLNFLSSRKVTSISVGGDVLGNLGDEDASSKPLSGEFAIEDSTPEAHTDMYSQIEEVIKSALTPYGRYALNRSVGLLEVSDRRETIDRIDNYMKTLKRFYNAQVLITAKILEVSLNDTSSYGIDWSSVHGNIQSFTFNPISQTLALATDNLSPALTISGEGDNGFSMTMNALEEFGKVKILSNPHVRVTNGQPALISVGRSTSYIKEITRSTTSAGDQTITETEVELGSIFDGLMFGVVPFIDFEHERVNLNITPIKSTIVDLEERTISGNVYTLPTVDLKEAHTQIRVRSGDLVVLGGLISKDLTRERKSIPILGDIPYLGYLFSQIRKSVETNELVILLEPVILWDGPLDLPQASPLS